MCACSVTKSCATFCDPMDCSPPESLFMEFSRQEYWSGLPFSSAQDLPNPESEFTIVMKEETDRTGSILKAGLHLGPDCGFWAIDPVFMEMTYQLENAALWIPGSGLHWNETSPTLPLLVGHSMYVLGVGTFFSGRSFSYLNWKSVKSSLVLA